MKPYTKTYLDYFGFKIPEDCVCEIPECGLPAVDLNHIQCRGAGGNPKGDKDDITNLMAMCRKCHEMHGDRPLSKPYLKEIHLKYMENNGKSISSS